MRIRIKNQGRLASKLEEEMHLAITDLCSKSSIFSKLKLKKLKAKKKKLRNCILCQHTKFQSPGISNKEFRSFPDGPLKRLDLNVKILKSTIFLFMMLG